MFAAEGGELVRGCGLALGFFGGFFEVLGGGLFGALLEGAEAGEALLGFGGCVGGGGC